MHAVTLHKITAPATAKELVVYFSGEVFPWMVVSDQGSQFLSNVVTKLWKLTGIQVHFSVSYYSESHGLIECQNSKGIGFIMEVCSASRIYVGLVLHVHQYLAKLQETVKVLKEFADENLQNSRRKQKERFDSHIRPQCFQVRDNVCVC